MHRRISGKECLEKSTAQPKAVVTTYSIDPLILILKYKILANQLEKIQALQVKTQVVQTRTYHTLFMIGLVSRKINYNTAVLFTTSPGNLHYGQFVGSWLLRIVLQHHLQGCHQVSKINLVSIRYQIDTKKNKNRYQIDNNKK